MFRFFFLVLPVCMKYSPLQMTKFSDTRYLHHLEAFPGLDRASGLPLPHSEQHKGRGRKLALSTYACDNSMISAGASLDWLRSRKNRFDGAKIYSQKQQQHQFVYAPSSAYLKIEKFYLFFTPPLHFLHSLPFSSCLS